MYLIIKNGPLKGQKIQAQLDLSFGRKKARVNLKDSKASSVHAKLQKNSKDEWILVDQGSRNGIKVDGKKLAQIKLVDGLTFILGSTKITVDNPGKEKNKKSKVRDNLDGEYEESTLPPIPKEMFDTSSDIDAINLSELDSSLDSMFEQDDFPFLSKINHSKDSLTKKPEKKESQAEEKNEIAVEPLSWRENLVLALKKVTRSEDIKTLHPFKIPLILHVTRGPHVGKTWTLGYGPRKAGPDSVDLTLFIINAPGICFEILPSSKGPLFKTSHADKVLLNTQSVSSEILNIGDVIKIGSTEIEIQ